MGGLKSFGKGERERISMYVKIVTEWPKQVTKYTSGNASATYNI